MDSADLEMMLAHKQLQQQKNNVLAQVIRKAEGDDQKAEPKAEEKIEDAKAEEKKEEEKAEEQILDKAEDEAEVEKKEDEKPKAKASFSAKAGKFFASIPRGINKVVGGMKSAANTANQGANTMREIDSAAKTVP